MNVGLQGIFNAYDRTVTAYHAPICSFPPRPGAIVVA